MVTRKLEQRQLLADGWTTEWEPADMPREGAADLAARHADLFRV